VRVKQACILIKHDKNDIRDRLGFRAWQIEHFL
jgi:hypothetical protein